MSEQESEQKTNIDKVATALVSRKKRGNYKLHDQKLLNLSSRIEVIISKFDEEIEECKKYNQAKIHRKYQAIIADLKEQIRILNDRIQIQQQSRSPSKKYVEDLLDQLVIYKNQVDHMKKEISDLKGEIRQLKSKILVSSLQALNPEQRIHVPVIKNDTDEKQHLAFKSFQKILLKIEDEQFQIRNKIIQYLKKKQKNRKNYLDNRTIFDKFLEKGLRNSSFSSFGTLLEMTDEWSQLVIKRPDKNFNTEKLKSHVLAGLTQESSKSSQKKKNQNFSELSRHRLKTYVGSSNIKPSKKRIPTLSPITIFNRQKQQYSLK